MILSMVHWINYSWMPYNRGKHKHINQRDSFLIHGLNGKGAWEMRGKKNLERKKSCTVRETDHPFLARDHFSTSVKIDEIFTGSWTPVYRNDVNRGLDGQEMILYGVVFYGCIVSDPQQIRSLGKKKEYWIAGYRYLSDASLSWYIPAWITLYYSTNWGLRRRLSMFPSLSNVTGT